jgi:hypothetical protein
VLLHADCWLVGAEERPVSCSSLTPERLKEGQAVHTSSSQVHSQTTDIESDSGQSLGLHAAYDLGISLVLQSLCLRLVEIDVPD